MAGPTIMAHGTDGRSALPAANPRGERSGARGSPSRHRLRPRGHRTAARLDGDRLRRDGEGLVVARPHRRLCILLTRTDPAPSARGMTYLLSTCTRRRRRRPLTPDHRRGGLQRDLPRDVRCPPRTFSARSAAAGGRDDDAAARGGTLGFALSPDSRSGPRTLETRPRTGRERRRARPIAGVDRAPGLRYTNLPLLTRADRTGVPGPGGLSPQAALVGGRPAAHHSSRSKSSGPSPALRRRRRRLLAVSSSAAAGTRSRPARQDPPQHRRRARARPAEIALMDLAFTASSRTSCARQARGLPRRGRPSRAGPRSREGN